MILNPDISGKSRFYDLPAGIYFFNTEKYQKFTDKPGALLGRAIWIYNHGGGNERIGILLCANNSNMFLGRSYGDESLTWVIK